MKTRCSLLRDSSCVKVKVAQSCPTLRNPMDYTAHGILQAIILKWVAFSFSKGSSHQGKSPIKEQLSNIWASELKQIIFFFFCLLLLDKYSKKINKFEN